MNKFQVSLEFRQVCILNVTIETCKLNLTCQKRKRKGIYQYKQHWLETLYLSNYELQIKFKLKNFLNSIFVCLFPHYSQAAFLQEVGHNNSMTNQLQQTLFLTQTHIHRYLDHKHTRFCEALLCTVNYYTTASFPGNQPAVDFNFYAAQKPLN